MCLEMGEISFNLLSDLENNHIKKIRYMNFNIFSSKIQTATTKQPHVPPLLFLSATLVTLGGWKHRRHGDFPYWMIFLHILRHSVLEYYIQYA